MPAGVPPGPRPCVRPMPLRHAMVASPPSLHPSYQASSVLFGDPTSRRRLPRSLLQLAPSGTRFRGSIPSRAGGRPAPLVLARFRIYASTRPLPSALQDSIRGRWLAATPAGSSPACYDDLARSLPPTACSAASRLREPDLRGDPGIRERWETEVLYGLQRQERRLDRARQSLASIPIPRRREHDDERPYALLPVRKSPRLDGQLELFATARRSLALARGNTLVARWLRFGRRGIRWQQDPERAVRRAVFRLASRAMPTQMREVLWLLRGLRGLGVRQR